MGISGLLGLLKSIHRPVELKKYDGETLGVDAYGWLHRGAISCALELAQGKPTRKYIDFCMHRVRMFKHFGVTPYLVFDGGYLPSKASTESSRESRREASKKAGEEFLRAGKPARAYQEFQKAIDVTPEMARMLIEELKKNSIPYVVAPYEADAQLVYLERQGLISGIVSEDSDLLVFGAKRLITKLDQHGQCIEINRKDFCAVREISLTQWTDDDFRHMAILSGCDYLKGINGMGLKTAYRMIRKHKTPERVVKMLQFEGNNKVPENYLADFQQANLTFLYQRVFCPVKQDIAYLTEPDASVDIANMPFIGEQLDTVLARSIATGDVNPITKKSIIIPASPGKRRISQAFGPRVTVPKAAAPKPPGKPIDEYFTGHRRIPLGEMDPNCFNVEQNHNENATAVVNRPVVFPLPRPYLGDASASTAPLRPYRTSNSRRQSEPVSNLLNSLAPGSVSQHRRRTAGPVVQVYQDPEPPTRPPKKARLCEDIPAGDPTNPAPEKSRFFPEKPTKQTSRKARESLMSLTSDDSIDEALRSLPDIGGPGLTKTSGRLSRDAATSQEATVDEILPLDLTKNAQDTGEDEIEVPASSPLQAVQKSTGAETSETPIGGRLHRFSYNSTRPHTKIVYGLPTPSSSEQKPADKPAPSLTPMLTPLQRIGSRALGRGDIGSMLPTPRRKSSGKDVKLSSFVPLNPASVPLPKVDLEEVEALNRPCGSEDQIIPDSDGESDADVLASAAQGRVLEERVYKFWSVFISGSESIDVVREFSSRRQLENRRHDFDRRFCSRCSTWKIVNRNAENTKEDEMADTSLKDRLWEHSGAFEGLLSLIPAKIYYGEDTSDQWKKKKQTKDQAKAAKRSKLDPDSELHRNAKEVLDERARNKRKLREMEEGDESSVDDDDDEIDDFSLGVEKEKPGEGLKKKATEDESAPKKQKLSEDATPETPKPPKTPRSDKKLSKEEKKSAKKLKKEEAKKAKKVAEQAAVKDEHKNDAETPKASIEPSTELDIDEDAVMAEIDVSGLVPQNGEVDSAGSEAGSTPKSPVFDTHSDTKNTSVEPASTTTSISSAVAPSDKPKYIKVPTDTTALRARLAAKIEALRAARKVDDVNGTPIRTRQELIESRRQKQAQRKAHKQELRRLAKEEEDRKREEALASARNSPGSVLSPMVDSDDDDRSANHFAFGRLAFADGVQMSQDLSYVKSAEKKKGPMDPKSALAKFESQKKRIAALDEDKRKEVLEKETWLAARRRVEGEKVHDDESLLKKAVKRKEKAKKKSEREWKERAKGVEDAIKGRQHKREENIKKRREEKLTKGKKKKGVSTKKKNRPGFEGGFGGAGKRK
ncbi:hypothetical protein V8F20_001775 [Naviculisporaceae sp. PSN 640]